MYVCAHKEQWKQKQVLDACCNLKEDPANLT